MKKLLFAALLLTIVSYCKAQSADDSVKATINHFFLAMKNADILSLKSTLAENALLHTVVNDGSKTSVKHEDIAAFVAMIGQLKAGDADEQIKFETVKTDGPLASVWTTYQFYYKGAFSHCGVNSFQLVRISNEWKIQYIIDTRKKTGCK